MSEAAQRLFFALWPDAALQAALHQVGLRLQAECGGRVVSAHNIHLTLAFLGSVPAARIEALRLLAAAVRAERFALSLDQTGCWKRSAIGWTGPAHTPVALEELVRQLRQHLLQADFHVDEKAFVPHVTLLRKARCRRRSDDVRQQAMATWHVDRFVLMSSQTLATGPEYANLGHWPLA